MDGSCLTPSGQTIAEAVSGAPEALGQEVVRSLDNPLKPSGDW